MIILDKMRFSIVAIMRYAASFRDVIRIEIVISYAEVSLLVETIVRYSLNKFVGVLPFDSLS